MFPKTSNAHYSRDVEGAAPRLSPRSLRRLAGWLGGPVAKRGIPAASIAGWLIGFGIIAALIARSDVDALWAIVTQIRFWIVPIVAWHACPLLCDSLAWHSVFANRPPPLERILLARWMGEGANSLLPIPHLGELLRAREARTEDHDGVATTASVLADITLGVASQVLFTALGLILLGLGSTGIPAARPFALLLPLAAFAIVFYAAQRSGALTAAAARIGRSMGAITGTFEPATLRRLDLEIAVIYRKHRAMLAGLVWHFASWLVGTGEIWIVMRALGHPIGIADAITIESLSQAARVAAFFIPAGLGAQEGALVALAAHFGIPADIALALALVKRFRELALGAPALIAAYGLERRLRDRRSVAATAKIPDAHPEPTV